MQAYEGTSEQVSAFVWRDGSVLSSYQKFYLQTMQRKLVYVHVKFFSKQQSST